MLHNGLYVLGDTASALYQSGMWHAAEDRDIPDDPSLWRVISILGE